MFQYCKLSSSVRVVKLGGKDCTYKGEKICNGAVTKEIGKKLVKVCKNGKVKTATRKSVGEGFPLVGRDTGKGKGKNHDGHRSRNQYCMHSRLG